MARTETGLKFSGCFLDSLPVVLDSKISWIYEARFKGKHLHAAFQDYSCQFTVDGYYPDRSLLGVSAAIKSYFLPNDAFSVSLGYDGEFSKHYDDQMVSLQFGYTF